MNIPFAKRKNGYNFVCSFVDNLELKPISNTAMLINWLEQENARLIERNQEGSVLVTKIDKKGDILVAKQIDLPINGTPDFDQYLYDFYSKKPIPFDQQILNGPINFDNFIDRFTPISKHVHSEVLKNKEKKERSTSNDQQDFFVSQTPEIDRLNAQLDNQVNISSVGTLRQKAVKMPSPISDTLSEDNLESKPEQAKPVPSIINQTEEDLSDKEDRNIDTHEGQSVFSEQHTSKQMTERIDRQTLGNQSSFVSEGKGFEQRLSAFLVREKQIIHQELQLIHQQKMIEKEVTERLLQEKHSVIEDLDKNLLKQKMQLIENENIRHKQELLKLEEEYQREQQSQFALTNTIYEEKTKKQIKLETNRRTKAEMQAVDQKQEVLEKWEQILYEQKRNEAFLVQAKELNQLETEKIENEEFY